MKQPIAIRRTKAVYGSPSYRQMWRIVEGAVIDALQHHPDYLTDKGAVSARTSIVKRVTGAVVGWAETSARGRSRSSRAADNAMAGLKLSSQTAGSDGVKLVVSTHKRGELRAGAARPIRQHDTNGGAA